MAGFDERAVTVAMPGGRLALDALFVAGDDEAADGALIAAPHPLYGGSMGSPVVNELAHAARKAGIASLRFDWRGVGASGGTPSGDPGDAVADYTAALEHLAETVGGALVACGYSFGAAAALYAGRDAPRVRRLVMVAPPPSMLDPAALAEFSGSVLVLAGENDALAPPAALEPLVARARHGRLVVVSEADHFFAAGLAEVSRVTGAWLGTGASQ